MIINDFDLFHKATITYYLFFITTKYIVFKYSKKLTRTTIYELFTANNNVYIPLKSVDKEEFIEISSIML